MDDCDYIYCIDELMSMIKLLKQMSLHYLNSEWEEKDIVFDWYYFWFDLIFGEQILQRLPPPPPPPFLTLDTGQNYSTFSC